MPIHVYKICIHWYFQLTVKIAGNRDKLVQQNTFKEMLQSILIILIAVNNI